MSDRPEGPVPSTYILNQVDVDRMIVAAVSEAVRATRAEATLTKKDVQEVVTDAINDLLRDAFDIPAGDEKAVIDLRGDIKALRDTLLLRRAALKHGTMAVVGSLFIGIGTLIVHAASAFAAKKSSASVATRANETFRRKASTPCR